MSKLYAGLAVAGVVALLGGTAGYVMVNQSDDIFADCRSSTVGG
ncbi:MAG: hypothetical protein RLZZ563_327, partial [Pseudomonadota bacterium]